MGSIYRRGNRYWVKYRSPKGRKVRRESAGATQLEALALLDKREGPTGDGAGPPLHRVLTDYLAHVAVRGKETSRKSVASSVKRLAAFYGRADAGALAPRDVNAYVTHRKQDGVCSKTVNNDLIALRAALRLAGLKSPVRLLRVPRKRVLPLLSSADIAALYANAREPHRGILLISAHTGFRLSETLHLTWRDVLPAEGKITVTAKQGWSAKSYEERGVYVPAEVFAYLSERRAQSKFNGIEDFIFPSRSGRTLSPHNVLRELRKVFVRAGLYQKGRPLTHWIRHSVASRLLGNGVDVETVRSVLGHADATTTLRYYAHTSEARLKAASEALRW